MSWSKLSCGVGVLSVSDLGIIKTVEVWIGLCGCKCKFVSSIELFNLRGPIIVHHVFISLKIN